MSFVSTEVISNFEAAMKAGKIIRGDWSDDNGGYCIISTLNNDIAKTGVISAIPNSIIPVWVAELLVVLTDNCSPATWKHAPSRFYRILRDCDCLIFRNWENIKWSTLEWYIEMLEWYAVGDPLTKYTAKVHEYFKYLSNGNYRTGSYDSEMFALVHTLRKDPKAKWFADVLIYIMNQTPSTTGVADVVELLVTLPELFTNGSEAIDSIFDHFITTTDAEIGKRLGRPKPQQESPRLNRPTGVTT